MGQASSSPRGSGGRRRSLRDSVRSPFPRKSQSKHSKSMLSATCNFMDSDRKFDQVNVNTASEEELMTLPGINRCTAHTIVEYRQAIGRFNKVEDLALVSGIGAEKLALIRPEICVSRRKNVSSASSRAQSFDSLQNNDGTRSGNRAASQGRMVNVNAATVFDLMAIHGFNQELAANVIHYRDRRGPFRTVDDLIKVKGINQWRLGALRSQVYIGSTSPEGSPRVVNGGTLPSMAKLGGTITITGIDNNVNVPYTNNNLLQVPNGKIPGHRKTMSVPIKYSPLTNGLLPNKDIFDLLSAYSQRPIVEEDFRNQRNGRPALRVATWNLHDFSTEKADNPGVRETVCRTILENKFSLIAVQEVVDNFALKKVCDELNYPTLRRVIDWKRDGGDWKYCVGRNVYPGQNLAFLFDTNAVDMLSIEDVCLEGCESSVALLAKFQLESVNVCLLNVHLHDDGGNSFKSVNKALAKHGVDDTEPILVLGDCSGMSKSLEEGEIERSQYKGVMPSTASTNSCNGHQELRLFDNIYISASTVQLYTGVWGVVRQGLFHLAIPRGWMWGGPASEHCPVWCELFSTARPSVLPVIPNGIADISTKV